MVNKPLDALVARLAIEAVIADALRSRLAIQQCAVAVVAAPLARLQLTRAHQLLAVAALEAGIAAADARLYSLLCHSSGAATTPARRRMCR